MRPFAYTTSRDSPWSPFWMSTTTQAGGLGSLSDIHTVESLNSTQALLQRLEGGVRAKKRRPARGRQDGGPGCNTNVVSPGLVPLQFLDSTRAARSGKIGT